MSDPTKPTTQTLDLMALAEARDIEFADEEYDFARSAAEVAEERGQKVVFPAPNQLQLDFDDQAQYEEFHRRRKVFFDGLTDIDYVLEEHFSRSGAPHRHVTMTFAREFTEAERILYQMALGSDIMREFLNAMRLFHGYKEVTRLFEQPDFTPAPATALKDHFDKEYAPAITAAELGGNEG